MARALPVMATYNGWAVVWTYPTHPASPANKPFITGRYFSNDPIPPHMRGHIHSLYETRSAAREAIAMRDYGKGRVVRVLVKMWEVRDGK